MNRLKIIKKRAERKGFFVVRVENAYYVVDTTDWTGHSRKAKSYREAVNVAYMVSLNHRTRFE